MCRLFYRCAASTGYLVTTEYFPLWLIFIPQGNTVPVFFIVFRNAVFYYVSLCIYTWFFVLTIQNFAVCSFVLTWTPFYFTTCSTIPSYKWHQDPGVDVPLEEHVLKYICFYENSWFLSDRKLSVKQIILFWDSPAIYICFCISIWEIFQLSQMGFLSI